MRVLSLTSPTGFAPRPVWGPAAGGWASRSVPPAKKIIESVGGEGNEQAWTEHLYQDGSASMDTSVLR